MGERVGLSAIQDKKLPVDEVLVKKTNQPYKAEWAGRSRNCEK